MPPTDPASTDPASTEPVPADLGPSTSIAVLLSGGVDSSVALRLSAERSDRVTAFYLKIWLEEETRFLGNCPWEDDLRYARAVAEAAGVPLEVVPLQREYYELVVSYALEELRAGRTPSPDIFCNQRIKFGVFFDAIGSDFERVATGHYGRIERQRGEARLLKGVDPVKDQTYFLSHLSAEQIARSVFPIGHLAKREVRRLADDYALPNAARHDSQGICFLGKIKFNDFVRYHLGEKPGPIIDEDTGDTLGEHHGYWFHTIGQRKGLGLAQGPWYVSGKDIDANVVFVSHAERLAATSRAAFEVEDTHWIHGEPEKLTLSAKLRHTPTVYGCALTPRGDQRYHVQLDAADPGIAPGQFAVFYDGDWCLGGARIAGLTAPSSLASPLR